MVARVLTVITAISHRADMRRNRSTCEPNSQVSVQLMEKAEIIIVRPEQEKQFPEEIKATRKENLPGKESKIFRLDPVMMDGLLRMGGRLKNVMYDADAKYQILLVRKSSVTRLLVEHHHRLKGHMGANQVLASLRQVLDHQRLGYDQECFIALYGMPKDYQTTNGPEDGRPARV